MSKKTFVIFGLLVIFLAVLIPWLAFRSDGDAARGAQKVPSGLKEGQDLFQTNCGNCHGANAPNNRPRFAQTGNEAASFTATQATSPNGGPVSGRIIARAVTTRDMPPACGRGALGTGACLDATEAAQLQTWVTQGGQP